MAGAAAEQMQPATAPDAGEVRLREDLAAAFRWAARLDMHEGVANHFSAAVGDEGAFLINPAGRHFSRMRASDLLLLDAARPPAPGEGAPDPTAWCLHARLHGQEPRVRCVMHLHPPYATALASLADWRLADADQNACRFHGRVAYDEDFGGMLLEEEEAERQARILGGCKVLVMRGHGVLTAGESPAEAFDLMYYFERACRNQHLAMAAGRPLFAVPPDVAEKTARQWESYPGGSDRHFAALREILDEEEPEYRR